MKKMAVEALHAQLGSLLENAQYLLADSAPSATLGMSGPHTYFMGSKSNLSGSKTAQPPAVYSFVVMQGEIRTLEFWRSIIAECMATFFYVAIVLSVTTSASEMTLQTSSAIAAGLAMVMLSAAFTRVSGGHTNPAITLGMMLTRYISPLRAILYICAQCGGGIAGSALVLGVHGRINDVALDFNRGTFGMEFVLTFLVVYAFFAAREPRVMNPLRPLVPGDIKVNPIIVGVAYAACLISWKATLNPARALGSAFVNRKFDQHWVFWVGPLLGAVTGAFAFEYIFNPRRKPFAFGTNPHPLEHISIHSEEDMLDDMERAKQYKANIMQDFHDPNVASTGYGTRGYKRPGVPGPMDNMYGGAKSMYNQSIYDSKSIYEGSKSMYDGYDGQTAAERNAANIRRSRSIHAKFPPGPGGPITRRNPYDYLPDEPNKPDIMQSSIVTENGTRLLGSKMSNSPRYHDGMDTYGEAPGNYHHGRSKSGLVSTVSDRPMDDSYESGYGATGAGGRHNGGVRDFGRQGRLRSDYGYSPGGAMAGTQGSGYNATYSQQNGCSIGPNAANYHPGSTTGGATVPPVGANY